MKELLKFVSTLTGGSKIKASLVPQRRHATPYYARLSWSPEKLLQLENGSMAFCQLNIWLNTYIKILIFGKINWLWGQI